MVGAIKRHQEKVTFVLVGAWNTFFGFALYAFLLWVFGQQAYWILIIPANIIAVTQNYLAYKFLVFKTRGNYVREYLKFYVVYIPSVVANLVILPILVRGLHIPPLIAQAFFIGFVVIVSYFGHKYFTFREPAEVLE